MGPPPIVQHFISQIQALGVTPEQKTQVHDVLREAMPHVQPLLKFWMQQRRELRVQIQTVPVDEAAIRAQSENVARVEADLAIVFAHIAERIRPILTPEQADRLHTMIGQLDTMLDIAVDTAGTQLNR